MWRETHCDCNDRKDQSDSGVCDSWMESAAEKSSDKAPGRGDNSRKKTLCESDLIAARTPVFRHGILRQDALRSAGSDG